MRIPKSVSDHAMLEDRYYGHRQISEAIERMIMALFSCTQDSMAAAVESPSSQTRHAPRLSYFVAYALYRTRLPMAVVYFALLLLKRLKTQYPVARGSSGHRLFISSFMLACKMLCDDAYNNKSWVIVSQSLFSLHEVNQMERELFMYLDLDLRVSSEELSAFALELERYGAPSVSLDDLKRTRLPLPSTSTSSTPTRSPAGKSSSSPAARRRTHRRCLSLRPDYWTYSSSGMPMSRHHRSESHEWSASSMQRWSRSLARSSMPSQRSAPAVQNVTPAPSMTAIATQPPYYPAAAMAGVYGPSPAVSWSSFYSTTNASNLSITTPHSLGSSLRPTPSTSMSELSLHSPISGGPMYSTMPMTMPSYHDWDHPAKVPAYEVNESFRMARDVL